MRDIIEYQLHINYVDNPKIIEELSADHLSSEWDGYLLDFDVVPVYLCYFCSRLY